MNLSEANAALRATDWSDLLDQGEGAKFAVLVNGEPVLGTVVQTESREDYYDDHKMTVVVEVAGQYFRKTGNQQNGSHCYGDYEVSWDELEEVRPSEKPVTVYVAV
jgi:hypothetical protein